jgi:hypothetical protein
MRYWCRLILLVLVLIPALVSPALGRSALIQTTAPLADGSEGALRLAVRDALAIALRGALAMGLPLVQLRDARRLDQDTVAIQVFATDEDDTACDDADAACHQTSDRERGNPVPPVRSIPIRD